MPLAHACGPNEVRRFLRFFDCGLGLAFEGLGS
jgi:hypothetical protein